MPILDPVTPAFYKVRQMKIVVDDGELFINYRVEIMNEDGHHIGVVTPSSGMTAGEQAAVLARYESDKEAFETATGLTEWVNPVP